MNTTPELAGIMVPLVTPFDENGDLAAEKALPLIERHIDHGVNGFYVGGSSGEGFLQSVAERCEYMRFVADATEGRARFFHLKISDRVLTRASRDCRPASQ